MFHIMSRLGFDSPWLRSLCVCGCVPQETAAQIPTRRYSREPTSERGFLRIRCRNFVPRCAHTPGGGGQSRRGPLRPRSGPRPTPRTCLPVCGGDREDWQHISPIAMEHGVSARSEVSALSPRPEGVHVERRADDVESTSSEGDMGPVQCDVFTSGEPVNLFPRYSKHRAAEPHAPPVAFSATPRS